MRGKENACHKNKGGGSSQWASQKGAEIAFPPKLSGSSDRSASLCHISLRRSSQRLAGCVWPGLTAGGALVLGQTSRPAACSPSRATRTSPHFTRFSLGASQGAAGAWGFRLQSCTLRAPGKWRGWPRPALTVKQPGGGEESRGRRTGERGEERGGRTGEERRRMTRG